MRTDIRNIVLEGRYKTTLFIKIHRRYCYNFIVILNLLHRQAEF